MTIVAADGPSVEPVQVSRLLIGMAETYDVIFTLPDAPGRYEIGDMTRYIWSFDGKTLAEDPVIPVSKGDVLRIRLVNDTMMHHPLHLHGHFFRLINGQRAR